MPLLPSDQSQSQSKDVCALTGDCGRGLIGFVPALGFVETVLVVFFPFLSYVFLYFVFFFCNTCSAVLCFPFLLVGVELSFVLVIVIIVLKQSRPIFSEHRITYRK